jgi:hypothetical protein
MKYIWEEKDIRQGRQILDSYGDVSFIFTCYITSQVNYVIMPARSLDLPSLNKEELVEYLNKHEFVPMEIE